MWCALIFSSARSSAVARTPFIGVRISWLILARKVDFDSAARMASSLAAGVPIAVFSDLRCRPDKTRFFNRPSSSNWGRIVVWTKYSEPSNWHISVPRTNISFLQNFGGGFKILVTPALNFRDFCPLRTDSWYPDICTNLYWLAGSNHLGPFRSHLPRHP